MALTELIVVIGVAAFVSAAVHFGLSWQLRVSQRRLEFEWQEVMERLLREQNRRAAAKSVESRKTAAAEFDAAIVAKHTGHQLSVDGHGDVHGAPDVGGMFDFFQKTKRPQ